MVEQEDAKKMGFAENVQFKKLRTVLRRRGAHADKVAAELKKALWESSWAVESIREMMVILVMDTIIRYEVLNKNNSCNDNNNNY